MDRGLCPLVERREAKAMTCTPASDKATEVEEAAARLLEAAAARKCWSCGCLANSLTAIESGAPKDRTASLDAAIDAARHKVGQVKYDCLGCDVCYPAAAMNALNLAERACAAGPVAARDGWPPLPGAYSVVRYRAPVAVCTLTDDGLARSLAESPGLDMAIAGTLQTENLGIERLVRNTIANPHIRFLIVCGADSRQEIGHLPGASLIALSHFGLDDDGRIVKAPGRRPLIRNTDASTVAHFRENVRVIDRIGMTDLNGIVEAIQLAAKESPGPARAFEAADGVPAVRGELPERVELDPAGYFVVCPDERRGLMTLEHYGNDGVLGLVVEGVEAAELYVTAIKRGLVTRLDHAAYLGRELARAEQAMRAGTRSVQDAAPQQGCEAPADECCCGRVRSETQT